jgi:pyruvate-ferredoxin/flavodoxin oxidoreductase
MNKPQATLDGNAAAAHVAYHLNEVIAIYPITPASPMGELADEWAAQGRPNIWGTTPLIAELQSEGGAAGAVHGALQTGALTTTFTASQGLLLMLPNMYKIAGELTPAVIHVAARSLATQALSIFGDHSDVMAVRASGFALLASGSVQEAQDLALISQAATLKSRIPFLHFFDGFRTSHEIAKIESLSIDEMQAMIDDDLVRAHRNRALSPERPFIRGTAQNPDVYFQARESVNPFYLQTPGIVQDTMDRFAAMTGRSYRLFDYFGAPDATRVIVMMGSGAECAQETVEHLVARGYKVGLIKVRLYRPFSTQHLIQALPISTRSIAVLDRTKEPGSAGEPLYQDVVTAISEARDTGWPAPRVIGGRYGLSSKEFTPAMVKAVLDELLIAAPKNHFTVGINDDVTLTSLDYSEDFSTETDDTFRAVFYGLGADGTVGANKNSIKIIGEETDLFAQGYFVYDSKKSGAMTVSHLRFGPHPIRSSYQIQEANFVACHQFQFLERIDMLELAAEGGTFLLNSPHEPETVWDHLPNRVQEQIITQSLTFYVVDANRVAAETGMGRRINTIMQTCFFNLAGVLPVEDALAAIKAGIRRTYGKRGEEIVAQNLSAVELARERLHKVDVPALADSAIEMRPVISNGGSEFVTSVTAKMLARQGDDLPVSALPVDGTYPSGTSKWEKRGIAMELPVWDTEMCIQCGKCVLICPHAVIRAKTVETEHLDRAPETFKHAPARWKQRKHEAYSLQISPDDCTGCTLCVEICPVTDKQDPARRAINMEPADALRAPEKENWDFFLSLPNNERHGINFDQVKDVQLLEPLFEFSGACAGCGETPYLKLMSQLYGERAIVANATGCSSIFGGNQPTTPWTMNQQGRGPAWSNSLFEDNAEFGLGMRLTLDKQVEYTQELLDRLEPLIGPELVADIRSSEQSNEVEITAQRARIERLKAVLDGLDRPGDAAVRRSMADLRSLANALVKKSLWIVGGDGWAYDIGFGGLDHVLASGRDVNILVLDTEVYSNTGGQMSKSTPRAATAKFAAGGKPLPKKDLGVIAMAYGEVYVAQVAMGGNDRQVLKAMREAESFPGPALILAYSPCIAHGYDLKHSLRQADLAVKSGYWPLYRHDPRRKELGKPAFQLDSRGPSIPLEDYIYNESRYTMLVRGKPEAAARLLAEAQADVQKKWERYTRLAAN